jgi:nitrite reductase/ring-hydroxylating ferredoxin subunit
MTENSFVYACEHLRPGARKQVKVNNRDVAIFHLLKTNKYHAIDANCYHHGGKLLTGDIEDLGDKTCVVCPLHHYKICLQTGEGLYLDLNSNVKSKGVKQRVHDVEVRTDGVYVRIQIDDRNIESDHYANMEELLNSQNPNQRERVDLKQMKQQRDANKL